MADLLATGPAQVELHRSGEAERNRQFGRKVFVRAVIEVSNYCRQNCHYCGMRRDNKGLSRFRLTRDSLRHIILEAVPNSVTDINFQTGEDPVVVREIIIPLIEEVRRETRYGVSVCLGTLDPKLYEELKQAGATYYIIKLETGQADHYRQLESPGTLEKRLAAIEHLQQTGWLVSSGFISGLPGQGPEQILENLRLLSSLPLAGCSVSPFIPGLDTPLADSASADIETSLNCVALMRLANPERVIPAVSAMNILQDGAYARAIRAGANLSTINLTPEGSRENYLLYKKDRFIMGEQRVLKAIEQAGCEPNRVGLAEHFEALAKTATA